MKKTHTQVTDLNRPYCLAPLNAARPTRPKSPKGTIYVAIVPPKVEFHDVSAITPSTITYPTTPETIPITISIIAIVIISFVLIRYPYQVYEFYKNITLLYSYDNQYKPKNI
jgi:hypothetical protein